MPRRSEKNILVKREISLAGEDPVYPENIRETGGFAYRSDTPLIFRRIPV